MAVTNKPWDGSASRFASTADYCDSCLINENDGPRSGWVQAKCKLPVKEPNGDVNANALRNAAARINQVDASPAAKRAAMTKLAALEKTAKIGQGGNSQQK